jgi:MFS family permease
MAMMLNAGAWWLNRWWPVVLLGFATIGAYGTAYYAVGVLLPVIAQQEGWSNGTLSAGFALGVIGQGALALFFGARFDRLGSRPVLLPALVVGSAALLVASQAAEAWQFVAAWSVGGAAIGGGLYYNVTMPVTARLYPSDRAAAFSVLTLLGAVASPIFYPLAAWLIEALGWRGGLQTLVGVTFLCVAPAALLVRAPGATTPSPRLRPSTFVTALREPAVARLLCVFALAGLANSAVLLHQVAALEATGLSLAAASGFAGARGAFQIPGRLFLTPITSRFGVRNSIAACYTMAATATLALLLALGASGSVVLPAYFAAMSGMSLGLLSPLSGLFQAESFGDSRLGTLSGVTVIVSSLATSSGAWLAGVTIELTGSYREMLAVSIVLQAVAVVVLLWPWTTAAAGSATALETTHNQTV